MKDIKILTAILMLICCAAFTTARAQDAFSMSTQYFQDGVPKAATNQLTYEDVDGTPYLYDGWAQGEVRLSDGKAYKGLFLKYDEVADLLIFKYAITDSAMAFAVPAVEFRFTYIAKDKIHTVHFLNGFEPAGDAGTKAFYQILSNGKTKLLKRTEKKLLKITEFNATSVHRRIDDNTTYYLASNNRPVKVNNSNKAVLAALSDKADQLKKYIVSNDLNLKDDADFARLVDYYNTL